MRIDDKNNKRRSIETVSSDWRIMEGGCEDGGVLNLIESAKIDDNQVDYFQYKGNNCICNQQSIVVI